MKKYTAKSRNGFKLVKGDGITDFRGKTWTFDSILTGGKVFTKEGRAFYPQVFGITVTEVVDGPVGEKTVTLTFQELDGLWSLIADADYYSGSTHDVDRRMLTDYIRKALKMTEGFMDRAKPADEEVISHAY